MADLRADQFRDDPRVAQAKALLMAALAEHQSALTGPRPADPGRKVAYDELIKQFSKLRAGTLYFPYLGSGIGRGPLVELADGSVKYDMISGIGVHHFGHSHPALVAAALDAALRDTVMQGNLQQELASTKLSQLLVAAGSSAGSHLTHCFLTTSGAMANENALKLAFQKRSPAGRVLAFERCFMGRTLALSQITDSPFYREGLPGPGLLPVDYLPFYDANRPQESRRQTLAVLEHHVARYPGQHAVMCMEMVQGEGGYYPGDRAFFRAIVDFLKSRHIALMVDEVQTFGRTQELFAFQHFGLEGDVDLVTIGKLSQVCATLFTDEYAPRPGLISQTFTASTSAILASITVIEMLRDGGFFGSKGRNALVFDRFATRLGEMAGRHPTWVSAISGMGGMIAFTPFDGAADRTRQCAQILYELGLICFTAGHDPTRLRFLPPVPVVTDADIDAVCGIIEAGLSKVEKGS